MGDLSRRRTETTRYAVVPSVGVRTSYHGHRLAYLLQAQDRCMDETLGRFQGRPELVDRLEFNGELPRIPVLRRW